MKQLVSFIVLCSCQLSDPGLAAAIQIKAEEFATFHRLHGLVCAHGRVMDELIDSNCLGLTDTGAVVRFECTKEECK